LNDLDTRRAKPAQNNNHLHLIAAEDLYLFARGEHECAFAVLGAHLTAYGTRFAVWAPNASAVFVCGDFNQWSTDAHPLYAQGDSGVWAADIDGVVAGMHYKYRIISADGRVMPLKADPYARETQFRPDTASMVAQPSHHQWSDQQWMDNRRHKAHFRQPLMIYELHAASWRRGADNQFLNYRELADQLIPYVTDLGFTHIQLMPITEYPFDGSWGYQPTGMFAPTRRLGAPDDLRYLIDLAHRHGVGVLLDWVPAHFPADDHSLKQFDGTCLYEHADTRKGFHPDWNTLIYNFGRGEVVSFLLSSAVYWLEEFHFDGLRVDAVASMLYLNYSRRDGEWVPNALGGVENLEAISLLQIINQRVHQRLPGVMMIAEESTAWPGVTQLTSQGGLGFGFKWNMGWMNDTLRYIGRDPIYRKYHHQDIRFGLAYAFSEHFILPLSHDEVVHGKRALLEKIPGDDWQKFATLRATLALMWAHPGKKLLFMGAEFAQRQEWNHDQALDWHLLEQATHRGIHTLVRDMNTTLTSYHALYELDNHPHGFYWLDADAEHQCVFAFTRRSQSHPEQCVIAVSNFTPAAHDRWRIGVPASGQYIEILNTDSHFYGGSGIGNLGMVTAEPVASHGFDWSVVLTLPPLGTLWLCHQAT
jgi:1,4-alpha-glucan branching enzyme